MSAAARAIPYEKQIDMQSGRTCGAACLSMVYRSFGKDVSQAEIWQAIAKTNGFGSLASTTHLMAKDALSRGLVAVAVVSRHPLQSLRLCHDAGVRAVLNHRLTSDSQTGHYCVLVDIDDQHVTLNDPLLGPERRVSHAELLELWQPRLTRSEIAGNAFIGIAEKATPVSPCWLCKSTIPSRIECPRCQKPVGLQPNTPLGCMNNACLTRMWDYVCCPFCDYTWTFSFEPGQSEVSNPLLGDADGLSSAEHSPWMKPLFAELNKFCDQIRSLPGAEVHSEVKKHLDRVLASKEKMVLAQSEMLIYAKMAQDQLRQMQETSRQKKEEHRQRVEALQVAAPALDGNALGRALLKNLGFIA